MIRELTDADFHLVVEKSPQPCMVVFWAIWSPSCMELTQTLEMVEKNYSAFMWIGKVNVDNEMKTANEYDVLNIPTMIIFKAGKEQERIAGAVTYAYLSKRIIQYCPQDKPKDAKKKGD
jgi:thioredoxin-like negative regulator of GroEL